MEAPILAFIFTIFIVFIILIPWNSILDIPFNWFISKTKYKQYQFDYISSRVLGDNKTITAWFKTDQEAFSYRDKLYKRTHYYFPIVAINRPYWKIIQSPYHKIK